jgi:diacylglycerol kinase family enzyme
VLVILLWRRLGAAYSLRYRDAISDRDHTLQMECYGVVVANIRRLGKSFELAPDSTPADGIFEIILIPRTNRWRLLRTVVAAANGKLFEAISEVVLLRVRSAAIESDRPMVFFGDGEILTRGQWRLDLSVSATPLRVIGPSRHRL